MLDPQFAVQNHTCALSFLGGSDQPALRRREIGHCFAQESEEIFLLFGSLGGELVAASIEKDARLLEVRVEVGCEDDLVVLFELAEYLFGIVDFRMDETVWLAPSLVQVVPAQGRPAVAHRNSIRVDHREDEEGKVVSQKLAFHIRLCVNELFHEPLQHVARCSLAWMRSSHQHDDLFRFFLGCLLLFLLLWTRSLHIKDFPSD